MQKTADFYESAVFVLLHFVRTGGDGCFGVSEKKGNAPDTRKGNKRINNSAENCSLTAENPCDEVKLKQTDTAPVEGADYHKSQ